MCGTILAAAVCLAAGAFADEHSVLRLGAPFADHAVLQRGRAVPVWGEAAAGEKVVVSFAGQEKTAVAGADGSWRVNLDPLDACAVGRELAIASSGGGRLIVSDILVGEVWLASGQSNMDCPLVGKNPRYRDRQGALVAQMTHKPQIRYLLSSGSWKRHPLKRSQRPLVWRKFVPEDLMSGNTCSAVAAYFALDVHSALDVPIGLVCAYIGGTNIDAWTPKEGTASRPDLKDVSEWKYYDASNWPTNFNTYPWRSPSQQPAVLWNGLVAPLAPYSCRGMIWYQGCHNWPDGEWQRYCSKMHALFDGWKEKFENDGFVIRFAQLAGSFSTIAQMQAKLEREEPSAAMAVICDLANGYDIHPWEKESVGRRLAAHALRRDYGFNGIQDNSPHVESVERDGTNLVVACGDAKNLYLYNLDTTLKNNFELAGMDGRWKRATIVNTRPVRKPGGWNVNGGTILDPCRIILCADGVPEPVRVRYLFTPPFHGHIYNEANLPLGPFEANVEDYACRLALTNALSVLRFDAKGRIVSVVERETGRELLSSPSAFAALRLQGGGLVEADGMKVENGAMVFRFPCGEASATVAPESFGEGFTFKVATHAIPSDAELCIGRMSPAPTKWIGLRANMASDDTSGLCVRPYDTFASMSCGADLMYATIPSAKAKRARFGIVAAPRARLKNALQAMTVASGRPHTAAGGAWSLDSDEVQGSYLNANVTAENLGRVLSVVERGGFDVLHFRENWYSCRGRYPVDTNDWPGGLSEMKAAVEKVHAAGYHAGLHTLTGCIDPKDPWVSGPENAELYALRTYTLAEDMAADADAMTVNEAPSGDNDVVFTYAGNGNAFRIGSEIVQYSGLTREPPYRFTGLVRGAFGTKPSAHAKGDRADYLQQRYLAFYPDPDKPLADKVADAIANVYNTCGFDMIYCDGTEGMGTIYGMAAMRDKIIRRCSADGRPCLNEDSTSGHPHRHAQSWWFMSRVGAWDFGYWAPKQYHDYHIESLEREHIREGDLFQFQLGWWSPITFHRELMFNTHTLDVMEYFASRNAGLDAPMSIWGGHATMKTIPFHVLRMMTVLGWYERARRARAFRPEVQKSFGRRGAEFRLRQNRATGEWEVSPVKPFSFRASAVDRRMARFDVPSASAKTGIRITSLFAVGQTTNAVVLTDGVAAKSLACATANADVAVSADDSRSDDGRRAFRIAAENRGTSPRGAWARASAVFRPYRAIGDGRALRFRVRGDGSGALLNVQLETPREYGQALCEHYVTLDFSGWRDVEIPMRERSADRYLDYVWPYTKYAAVFQRWLNRKNLLAVNFYLNEIPAGGRTVVEVTDVEVVPERELRTVRHEIAVNGVAVPVPFEMESGMFAELDGDEWTLHAPDGEPLRRVRAVAAPRLRKGGNEISYSGETSDGAWPRAQVEVFAIGNPVPAFVPMKSLGEKGGRLMAYEAADPQLYAPDKGFDALAPLTMRPDEEAKVEVVAYGPASAFTLCVGDVSATVPALGKDEQRKIVFDGRHRGVLPVRVASDSPTSVRLEFAKRYIK